MSMQKVSVMVPPLPAAPRGALWLGSAVSWLFGADPHIRTGLPAWLEAVRAKLAVDRAARRDARSRDDLLALARRYQSTQPEFAKDLFAAASNDRGR
ncbi:MAG TPA: hypothetical protein VGO85_05395 [Caldimonas sp.]|jgi:hypothetical protein|nr:hypothetical protein [Caldimonas sp.]